MVNIDSLVATMSIEDKAGQLNMLAWGAPLTGAISAGDATSAVREGKVGSLLNLVGAKAVSEIQRVAVEESRLKIPLFFGDDTIHGHRTSFPIPLAEAGIFDAEIWARTARIAADEAAQDGQDITFAPMIDVARDPRWGRSSEGAGEDPWVNARFGAAKTQGFQGTGLEAQDAVAACAKHFCGYGAVTGGREYAAGDVSNLTLREVYLPPFEASVRAGVATIMPALSALSGTPMTAHRPLLQGWLRDRLGFEGIVISDYGAVRELINHGTAGDAEEAAALCIKAGCDIDMMGYAYVDHLPGAVQRGLVSVAEVDACVRRVLAFKERLGLFEDPYRRCRRGRPDAQTLAERRLFAREVARRSLVLLTNRSDLLPVAPGHQFIAVIGPLADAPGEMRGPWSAAINPLEGISVVSGLRAAFPDATIDCQPGVAIFGGTDDGIPAAAMTARNADFVVLCVGESASMSGEATSRTELDLPGRQRALAEAVLECGKPVIAIVFGGRPPIIPWLAAKADTLIAALYPGNDAGAAIADIIAGLKEPTGRLAMTWPRAMGQVPIFYGERPSGRPFNPIDHYTSKYLDCPNTPLFYFGHGLSTTTFSLSNLRVDDKILRSHHLLEISVDISNTGVRLGEATVFLFVHDPVATVTRPVLELRGTRKIKLEAGRCGTVNLVVSEDDIAFARDGFDRVIEPGTIDLLVGLSADPAGLLGICITVGSEDSIA